MKKVKTAGSKPKLPYQPPRDKIEKLGLIGNMGYISANPNVFTFQKNKQLAWWRS